MYYKIYTDIRDASWQCLIDHNIDSLPVDVLKIARQSNIDVKKNSRIKVLLPDEYAKSFYNGDKWIIVYNDLSDVVISRFAIAHELGHILLGHVKTYSKYATIEDIGIKPKAEKQADMFALRLLCPACVLMGIQIDAAEDIARVCRIPGHWAKIRWDRMKDLYKKDKFLTSNIENAVYKSFERYVKKQQINRKETPWHTSPKE